LFDPLYHFVFRFHVLLVIILFIQDYEFLVQLFPIGSI
jgi:hypothetical protein